MTGEHDGLVPRRKVVAMGAAAAGVAVAGAPHLAFADAGPSPEGASGRLPVQAMESILELEGTVTNGVLVIDVARDDIGNSRGPLDVLFTPAFEIDGTLTFQPLAGNRAFFNGDLALKPEETNRFIDAIFANGLVFQAFHQHFHEMRPQVWFIHFRGVGEPKALARKVRNVLGATSTPLPQTLPPAPKTPLDPDRLARILDGDAEVGEDGVVTVSVSRTDRVTIDGVVVSPEANISSNIMFKPLGRSGTAAVAAPDFSMTGPESARVIPLMRHQGWEIGCLYNQETDEQPQLFFSHMVKRGEPYELAREIRKGLDLTAV